MSVRLENDTTTTHITELYVPRGSLFSWLQVIDLKDIIAIRVPFLDRLSFFFKQRSTYTLVLDVISLNIPSGNDVNRLSKSVLKESFDFCDKWYGGNHSPEKKMKSAAYRNRIKFRRQLLSWNVLKNVSLEMRHVQAKRYNPRMQQVWPSVASPVYQKLCTWPFKGNTLSVTFFDRGFY